jgi:hypothetical protein
MQDKAGQGNKMTFMRLRERHGGSVGALARASGLDEPLVRLALLNWGITPATAEQLLATFNRLHGARYRLEDMDVRYVDNDEAARKAVDLQRDVRPERVAAGDGPLAPEVAGDGLPTFGEICAWARVEPGWVARQTGAEPLVGEQMAAGLPVFVEDCDDMLAELSDITGREWTRETVAGIRLRADVWNNGRLVPRGTK